MAVEILTKEDLRAFKEELLEEMKVIFAAARVPETKKWLKTWQVKEMLGISDGTLQKMRNKGIISYSIIGGLAFYEYGEVVGLMERGRNTKREIKR